ncbi:transposase [Komagataeibacter europaeus]|uniref:Transposase n=2 Tax=Komagataeibacter TaxID=1434011 RepID=A0A0N1F909_9PROT|nr:MULTISPECIES: transposase [Komagataeibacter]KDU94331.1 transposase [Komagataeibacter rhaeticus AF1]KDU96652.1 transposase [Komagataeibacter rhaeticus AF1]KDU97630.1 transposase [Komagataeibacter rhaeticus AF1]KON62985.1 transposase [Komagataeibacter europaeus]KPH86972.1 transposase [Komagataeibacter intermedius AF2]
MGQEILIGVERRRRWSDERKLEILAEVGVDGAGVSDVARRHGLTRQHLYQWRSSFRQRLSAHDQDVHFVPVAPVGGNSSVSGDYIAPDADGLAIVLRNGRCIRVTGHPAEELLARVIRIAETA